MAETLSVFRNARTRLALASIALSTILTAAVLALVYVNANRTISGETRSVVTAELAGLADEYDRLGMIGLITAINRRTVNAAERDAIYLLVSANGRVLAGNISGWPQQVEPGSGWVELTLKRPNSTQTQPVAAASIQLNRGEGLLVGRYTTEARNFDQVLLQSVGLALLASVALSLLTGWLLTRLVFSRLADITRTADEIMSGDLSRRIPLRGSDDEFERMAATLNDMLDLIENLIGNLRMTTNSIAHDLRSPLSRLRQRVELLTSKDRTAEERELDAARAMGEVDHLLRVFSQLTEISRAEAGIGREEFEPLDLKQLVHDVMEFYEPVASDKGITIAEAGSAGQVLGHRTLIAQALSNLLENALRYTPEGARIDITVAECNDHVLLSVRDGGPGVPEQDLGKLAQPFVTLDPSRTEKNAGLGLALVAAIARLHEGALSLSNANPGLKAELSFARAVGG
ncbi:HAMP domain-containing sensor histidine kinase [Ruegeria sp. 2205SS24-7]|uniref:sensor histidine kinase n=1 Tax=Ruegeria discodermiae TaxID=3064389 RepID=UPI00274083F9|nr:HAMP domain-containing sensor histidine kinase [Ruegeria sp. 2205SS24-7]MDP5216093.1 HAMP domain-containing sensor histidine kinase [Ruegeria sp. 2205SS24-7]